METAPDVTLSKKQRKAFSVARRSAARVLKSRYRSLFLARVAYKKLFKDKGGMQAVAGDVRLLIRLVQAWARKEYRAIPWRPLLYATAALAYFVSPLDLIPDLIPGLGFIDDVAIVGAVLQSIQRELQAFKAWEQAVSHAELSEVEA